MKTIDISQKVMKNVVSFEKKRSLMWIVKIILLFLMLFIIFAFLIQAFLAKVLERQTLYLLSLFTQDREIILEYWQDTLTVFWEELPHLGLYEIFIVLLIIIMTVIFAVKKIPQLLKKLQQVQKFPKKTE